MYIQYLPPSSGNGWMSSTMYFIFSISLPPFTSLTLSSNLLRKLNLS